MVHKWTIHDKATGPLSNDLNVEDDQRDKYYLTNEEAKSNDFKVDNKTR